MRKYILRLIAVMCILTVDLFNLNGCSKKESDSVSTEVNASETDAATVYLKVGEDEVTEEEMYVYCLLTLLSGQIQYLNVLADEDMIEDMVLEEVREKKILYREAVSQGVTMTKEDMETVDGLRDSFASYVTDEVFEEYNISSDIVDKVFLEKCTVEKLENDKQNEIGQQLTDKYYEESSGYNFQKLYYMVFPVTEVDEEGNPKTDADGKVIALSDKEKEEVKKKAEKLVMEVNSGTDAEKLCEEYEISDFCEESYGYEGGYSEELNEKLKGLTEGQCTELFENENCYYSVAVLKDHDDSLRESYAYSQAKQMLDEEYGKLKEEWLAKVKVGEDDLVGGYWKNFVLSKLATTLYEKGLMQ